MSEYLTFTSESVSEGHPDKILPVTGGFDSLSETEKRRCSVQVAEDGTETLSVCSDADFAVETSELTKLQIMQQAGIAALAQAKNINQSVVSLLG